MVKCSVGRSTVTDPDERIRIGLIFGVVGLISYCALPGTLTSYSQVQPVIQRQFNITNEKASLINSLTLGFTVGASPFSSPLFIRYGFFPVLLAGTIGSTVTLVAAAYATSYSMLLLSSGIIFGVFNNFCYNSMVAIAGKWLKGSKYVGPGTVLVSCGISISAFIFNKVGANLVEKDDTTAVKCRFLLLAGINAVTSIIYIITFLYYGEPPEGSLSATNVDAINVEEINLKSEVENTQEPPRKKTVKLSELLTLPIMLWFIGTSLWGLVYAIPFTSGKSYLIHNFELGINQSSLSAKGEAATKILAWQGSAELIMRVLLVFTSAFLPTKKGAYAWMFSLSSFLVGLFCIFISYRQTLAAAWFFFMGVCAPLGFLNAMVYTASENVFGVDLIDHVWPWTNLTLALGFAAGPYAFEVLAGGNVNEYPNSMRMMGFATMVAGLIMLACFFLVRK